VDAAHYLPDGEVLTNVYDSGGGSKANRQEIEDWQDLGLFHALLQLLRFL